MYPTSASRTPVACARVILNLVDNAIKFTELGTVEIRVELEESPCPALEFRVRFTVTDTGIGISKERQASIFQPFTQADMSTTRRYGGTGLGLTIATRLAALLGGNISLTSEPGRGSQFQFVARLRRGAASKFLAPAPAATPTISEQSLCVLVAEDNDFNSHLLKVLLEQRGHTLELAVTGDDALRLSEAPRFDLLLLDLHMPGLDGFQVIEQVRARERATGVHLPVIALTARSRREDRDRCLAAGMDGFLTKPLSAKLLWEAIERVLSAETHDAHRDAFAEG